MPTNTKQQLCIKPTGFLVEDESSVKSTATYLIFN